MDSADVVNYAAAIAIILAPFSRLIAVGAGAIVAYFVGRKFVRKTKLKKQQAAQRIASGVSGAAAVRDAAVNKVHESVEVALPLAKGAVVAAAEKAAPMMQQAGGAAKAIANLGIDGAVAAAPHVQKAAVNAFEVLKDGAVKAAPIAVDGIKQGAKGASELMAKHAPAAQEKARGFLLSMANRLERKD